MESSLSLKLKRQLTSSLSQAAAVTLPELKSELERFAHGDFLTKLEEVLDEKLTEKLNAKLAEWASVLVFEMAQELHRLPLNKFRSAGPPPGAEPRTFASMRFGSSDRQHAAAKPSAPRRASLRLGAGPALPATAAEAVGKRRSEAEGSNGNEPKLRGAAAHEGAQRSAEPNSSARTPAAKLGEDGASAALLEPVGVSDEVGCQDAVLLEREFLPGDDYQLDSVRSSLPTARSVRKIYQPLVPVQSQSTTFVDLVRSELFERVMGMFVLLNGLLLGFAASYAAEHPDGATPSWAEYGDLVFCIVFICELTLRLHVYGWDFWTNEQKSWNWLDFILVFLQVLEHLVQMLSTTIDTHSSELRLLRLLRIVRLLRVLHLFDELQAIVNSINSRSFKSLLWSMALLVMVVYMFSVLFLGVVNGAESLGEDTRRYWFGNLGRTMLTMFEVICGGVSWDEVAWPLTHEIGASVGVLFCGYVAIGSMAMLNLITGIFVDVVIASAHEDRDQSTIRKIRNTFLHDGTGRRLKELSCEEFSRKMEDATMQEYFAALDVRPFEAPKIFSLLDVDGSGTVSADEIVSGCLTMRGTAKGLDVCVLLRELNGLRSDVLAAQGALASISETMESVAAQEKQHLEQQAASAPTFRRITLDCSTEERVRGDEDGRSQQ